MPHLFPFASQDGNEDAVLQQEMGEELSRPRKLSRRQSLLKKIDGLLKRHHEQPEVDPFPPTALPEHILPDEHFRSRRASLPEEVGHRKAIPSLPRPQTFRRQESERREKLLEVPPSPTERRALSVDRRRGLSASAASRPLSPKPVPIPSASAPDITKPDQQLPIDAGIAESGSDNVEKSSRNRPELPPLQIPERNDEEVEVNDEDEEGDIDLDSLQEEYERCWILNLSMHFRDKSNREKFFVTYAETRTKWRRLTVSLDYRNAPDGSLEADLSTLHYQRDKSFRIYEAIRESLPDIQYYNTVTNLKLETTPDDGQLHVHVREDANEIISYPSTDLFGHIRARRYRESDLEFIMHLSGFVYKVKADDRVVIKKEIPGPDTVDEFLYEVNALDSLLGSRHVVQLEGLVTDESGSVVKGLLISYASQGALVDMLFDFRNTSELPWYRREKWAQQIVQGLSDIHEAGFVQGDFTLSNIVIDEDDNAIIIDINRRGCPVGWEPPELSRLIDSGQRIGMCISVKTDLFQLGMVLWALAEVVDEPERVERPLPPVLDDIPVYFRRMVETCLSERPQGRPSAKRMLRQFPSSAGRTPSRRHPSVDFIAAVQPLDDSVSTRRSDKEYIDPDMAVTLADVGARHRRRRSGDVSPSMSDQVTYFDPQNPESTTSYRFESSGSWVVGRRGRSPVSSRRRRSSPFAKTASTSSATSVSRSPPSRSRRRCGSESSENEREAMSPVTAPCTSDLSSAPAVESTAGEEPSLHLQNKRLADVRDTDLGPHSPLLHTDSGFDEHMVEELDFGPTEAASAHPEESIHDHCQVSTPDTPTPGSFHTPIATSGDGLAKTALLAETQADNPAESKADRSEDELGTQSEYHETRQT